RRSRARRRPWTPIPASRRAHAAARLRDRRGRRRTGARPRRGARRGGLVLRAGRRSAAHRGGQQDGSAGSAALAHPAQENLLRLGQDVISRSEEHTSELQSRSDLVCRLLLEKKKKNKNTQTN